MVPLMVKIGLMLASIRNDLDVVTAVAETADELGFDSVWVTEHMIAPAVAVPSPNTGHDYARDPHSPDLEPFLLLAYLAGRTRRIRLGTGVALLGTRHPFLAAREIQTLDVVSAGRAEVGVGAGWVKEEWDAQSLDFGTRGRRLDEVISVCRRLWSESLVEHHGEFFDFGPVGFEPKPAQRPYPPIHIGGESPYALDRAARIGDGWLGRDHLPASAMSLVTDLRKRLAAAGRDPAGFQMTVRPLPGAELDLEAWVAAGVTRILVAPWGALGPSPAAAEAIEAVRRYALAAGLR
jgi:probable F420-dependent oxidoreductase